VKVNGELKGSVTRKGKNPAMNDVNVRVNVVAASHAANPEVVAMIDVDTDKHRKNLSKSH
jgi:hypothetical protein